MGALVSGFALALVAVNYGWVPASQDADEAGASGDGYEYVVQVDAEELRALAEGRVRELTSAPPAELRRIDRITLVVGDQPPPRELTAVDRQSPRRIANSAGPVRHTVAKPEAPDWLPPRETQGAEADADEENEPERRTAYQNPQYVNPSAVQRGFEQGSNVFTDAAQDVGQATRQTGRDLRDGARGVVGGLRDAVTSGVQGTANVINNTLNIGNDQYANQRRQQAGGAPAPTANDGRYVPFNYNQPTTAGQPTAVANQNPPLQPTPAQRGFDQFTNTPPVDQTQFTTPAGAANPNTRDQYGPSLPQTNPNAGGDIIKRFGAPATGPPEPQPADRRDDRFVRSEGNLTPVDRSRRDARPTQVDLRLPNDRYPNSTGFDNNPPVATNDRNGGFNTAGDRFPQTGGFDNRQAPQDPWANSRQTPPASSTGFDTPRFGQPSPPAQQPPFAQQPPPNQQQNWYTGTAQNAGGQGQDPSVQSWGADANQPGVTPASTQQAAAPETPKNPLQDGLWLLLLAGSLAGNLYVGTTYLDVRNKYRAALRRLPMGLQDAA